MKNSAKILFMALALLAGSAGAVTATYTASGSWTAPAGVTTVDVEVWGGGGAGGGQNLASDGGGGAGGGAYSRQVGITVVPGNTYTFVVGAGGVGVASGTGGSGGDSYFINAATVMARGGAGGPPSTGTPPAGGLGGASASGVGTTRFSGGNGGTGRDNNAGQGGPGGSSAGTAANGTSGTAPWTVLAAAAAPVGGGIGGDGGNVGINGFAPATGNGGGGGGSGDGTTRTGGNGATGKVAITYAGVPVAATNAATGLAISAATLNGTVSSNGAATTVTFEYWTGANPATAVTAAQSPLVSNAVNSAVSAALTGLVCSTTYSFRVVAANTAGTTNGTTLTFATLACPLPTVTTNAATAVTTTIATLNGAVNDNGYDTTVTFEYGTTLAYGSTIAATQSPILAGVGNTAVSATVYGLLCNTTYHFRARGANAFGSATGIDRTFATVCTAPTATTTAATALKTTGGTLNGTVNDNGASTTVTFEYGPTVAYGTTITAAQSPVGPNWGSTVVSAAASGLNCSSTYHYRVRAVSAIGTTNGGDLTFTTSACPTSVAVTSSPTSCTNVATIGTRAWTTLDAIASDNSFATTTLNDGQQSNYLQCTGYGFAIPAGATINGITVSVERSATGTNSPINDLAVRVLKAGVIGTTDRSTGTTYPVIDTVEAHGGATDLWGTTWTVANINAANFGAALAAHKNGNTGATFTVNVDHMPITVNYTPTTSWVASIDRMSPNPTAAATIVTWDVLFSANATGVDVADFVLVQGGSTTGAFITGVTGNGRVWRVTANTGTGATGTLGLNLVDNDTIIIGGAPLAGAGANNGDFTGQVYTLEIPVCTGSMIFCDDFERANPGAVGNGWTVTPAAASVATCAANYGGNTGCAGIDTDIPPFNATTNRANPTRSMFTRWTQVWVDSRTIDLSSHSSVLLKFWMRRGGDAFSEYPEATGENYLVQYLDSTGGWKILAQYPSGIMQGQVFTPVIQLPLDAMHANFRMRFYQPSGSGNAGGGATGGAPGVVGYDYWHMDDVIIEDAPTSSTSGAFCDDFGGGLERWSFSAEGGPANLGLPNGSNIGDASLGSTDYNSSPTSPYELDMRWGYVTASTLRTDMTGVTGNITYWVKSGTTAARDPDAGEDLVVEYYNSTGTWSTLATYPGTAAAGTIYNASHVMPANAQHPGFRLRFRMLSGSGYDNDYWHIDDVCVGTLQPHADLSITKTRNGLLVPGSNASYTLSVTNNGPDNIANGTIQVVDTLPTGLTYYSAIGAGWTCSANGQVVTCGFVGSVNSGASAPPITLTVAVDPSANGSITNTATVTGSAIDANLGNNTASDTATLTPGFVFTDGVCVTGRAFGNSNQTCHQINWSPQIAGRNLNGVYITSVNTSTIPTQLSAVSATTINMEFGLSCINPIADANVRATFSATASALELCEASGATPTTWTPGVNLSFPAGNPSVGPYTFNYADVGQVSLYMRNSALTTQTGASGTFTVKPGGFVLSAIERNRDNFANPAATGPGGAAFVKAGEAFNVTVTATTCTPASTSCPVAGVTTPNYGQEAPPESVMLTVSNVTAGMIAAPAVGGGIFGAFNNGVATADGVTYLPDGTTRSTPFSWGEVGVIRLTPSVADGNYFLDGDTMGTASVNIGRFYPDHFDTAVQYSAATGIFMQCPAGLSCPAANYLADWSYANAAARVAATGFVATDIDRVAMQLDNNSYWRLTAVTPTWAQLVPFLPRGFVYSGQAFKVQVAARNVSGGTTQNYNSTSGYANPVTLNAWDALGSTTTQNPSGALTNNTVTAGTFVSGVATTSTPVYTLGTMPTAPIAPTDIFMRAVESAGDTVTSLRATPASSSEGGIKVLSGRIKVSNAYGSELLPLTLTATAQYYTATGWVNCLVDSVTRLVLTYGGTISPTPVVTPNPVSGVVSGGNVTVGIAAPGAGRTGTVTVTPSVDPASPGVPGLMLIPGTATFGVYKSNSGFIYRRESY